MNITTTSELDFSASASEKGLPSIVVREKAGAAAPMLGAGVSAWADPAARTTRQRAARAERTFIANISLTHPQDADGEKNSPVRSAIAEPAGRAEPDPRPGRAAAGPPDRTSRRTCMPR